MADKNNAMRLFRILEILQKHSDKDHPLSQQDIIRMLWDKYEIHADRKTIKNNIVNLEEMGFDINYAEADRSKGTKKENTVTSHYYMNNEFDDSELRLLIDSVLYSPNISPCQSKQLIEKLQNQSSGYFKSHTKHIACMPSRKSENKQLFHTIDIIDEAISAKKKVTFKHLYYGTDLKLHVARAYNVRTKGPGSEIRWRVSPYQIAMSEGKYYLICTHVHDKIIHIPLDEIIDVEILEEKAQPFNTLIGSNGQPLNLKEYMNEHIFMSSGVPVRARLRLVNDLVFSTVTDTFGKNVTVLNPDSQHQIDIEVKAPKSAIYQFAMKNMWGVTVIEPDEIAKDIKKTLAIAFKNYKAIDDQKNKSEE